MSPANINVKKRKKRSKTCIFILNAYDISLISLTILFQKKLLVTKELQERLVLGKKGVKTPSLNSSKEALKIFQRVKVVLSKILRRPTALVMSQVNATVNSVYTENAFLYFFITSKHYILLLWRKKMQSKDFSGDAFGIPPEVLTGLIFGAMLKFDT